MGVPPAPQVTLRVIHAAERFGPDELISVGRRENTKRAVLFVSKALGKHLAVDPAHAMAAGELLAHRVALLLDPPVGEGDTAPVPGVNAVVVGYAETATALGHIVRRSLGPGPYAHTTRVPGEAADLVVQFEEPHSHATMHRLYHTDPGFLRDSRPVVLVDDELTTGRTVANTIRAIQRLGQRDRYVVAVLADMRSERVCDLLETEADRIATRIDVVSLLRAEAEVCAASSMERTSPGRTVAPRAPGHVVHHGIDLPAATARRGWDVKDERALDEAVLVAADAIERRRAGERVLVLGDRELMYAPIRLAAALGGTVRVHSTSISPVVPSDVDGYPIRSRLALGPGGAAPYVYNLGIERYDNVVVCVDPEMEAGYVDVDQFAPAAPNVHVIEMRSHR